MNRIFPRNRVILSKAVFAIIKDAIEGKKIIEGPEIAQFEQSFAACIGSKHAISVSSARTGFMLILKALDFPSGSEIIFPAYTFHVIPAVVKSLNLKPVFVDVRKDTYTIDTSLIEQKITSRTKAIITTHILGQPCAMDEIMALSEKYHIKVIEDCAHACGAEYKGQKVGSFGIASIFSFGMGKLMNCFGGGMITCTDAPLRDQILKEMEGYTNISKTKLAKRISKYLVFSLFTRPMVFACSGYLAMRIAVFFKNDIFDRIPNEPVTLWEQFPESFYKKFTNLQAMIGIEQLKYLDKMIDKIIRNAEIYNKELSGTQGVVTPYVMPDAKHVYLYYRIRAHRRDKLIKSLLACGLDAKKDDIAHCPELSIFHENTPDYPAAKEIATTSLELPCGYYLSEKDVYTIAHRVKKTVCAL